MSHRGTDLSSATMWSQRCKSCQRVLSLSSTFFEVREMMAKEGVVLDFSDTKLKGWRLFMINQNLTKPTTKVEL